MSLRTLLLCIDHDIESMKKKGITPEVPTHKEIMDFLLKNCKDIKEGEEILE